MDGPDTNFELNDDDLTGEYTMSTPGGEQYIRADGNEIRIGDDAFGRFISFSDHGVEMDVLFNDNDSTM